jgi:hypothetical protein
VSTVPLDLQRRFERRWAARFGRPTEPARSGHRVEKQDQQRAKPTKKKSSPAGSEVRARELSADPKPRCSVKGPPRSGFGIWVSRISPW